MRLIASGMIAVALLLAAGAVASPQFVSTFQGTYSTHVPGASSGLDALATWSDPGEAGGKPKQVSRIKVSFAPGTRLDTSALPACRASDLDVQVRAVRACPRATMLGSVRGQALYPGSAPFNTFATLFNARRQIIVVVTLDSRKGRLLTNFRDDVRRSSITVNLKVPGSISLIRFHAHAPPHSRGTGRKRKSYFTTPPTCPAGGAWTTTATFTYTDGSSDQHSTPTPCDQPKATKGAR